MVSRGLFGWSPPHMQPLTPVSEVSEPPESPSPYMDIGGEAVPVEEDAPVDELEEIEPPPAAVPFSRLFACADGLDWVLMAIGSLAAAAHGAALVVYLHYFGRIINLLARRDHDFAFMTDDIIHEFKKVGEKEGFLFFFGFYQDSSNFGTTASDYYSCYFFLLVFYIS